MMLAQALRPYRVLSFSVYLVFHLIFSTFRILTESHRRAMPIFHFFELEASFL